ncbi:unnamed protein product [Soboliphyme baturini]|uniref:C-type lectin domain-containing protein n=1 Tax=Soboliphyme baturini TaxID=241478 RepID=A0A183ID57_9BILA|nr:unnamed protein product [Soboliphyme baturini]
MRNCRQRGVVDPQPSRIIGGSGVGFAVKSGSPPERMNHSEEGTAHKMNFADQIGRVLAVFLFACVSDVFWRTKPVVFGQTQFFNKILKTCTFPDYTQGIYKMQDPEYVPKFYDVAVRDPIRYKDVFIGPSFISKWGDCYEQHGHGYIVSLKKVGGYLCFRCIVIIVRTPNVVQINTRTGDACYTDVAKAKQECNNASMAIAVEGIMLWRSENVQNQYCPLGGRANFTYAIANNLICPLSTTTPSTANNCDLGFQLDLSFRSCNFFQYSKLMVFNHVKCCTLSKRRKPLDHDFDFLLFESNEELVDVSFCIRRILIVVSTPLYTRFDRVSRFLWLMAQPRKFDANECTCAPLDLSLQCLGSWKNGMQSDEIYFGLYNIEAKEFRCGLMKAGSSAVRSTVLAALSNDSSCHNMLKSSASGYEEFTFFIGDWETVAVSGDTMSFYKQDNPSTMAIIYGKCIDVDREKFRIYSKNHCDDEVGSYCISTKRRTASVLEYKLAPLHPAQSLQHCSEEQVYKNSSWLMLSKRKSNSTVPCSLVGRFTSHRIIRRGNIFHNISSGCNRDYLMTYSANVYGQSDLKEGKQRHELCSTAPELIF